MPPSLAPLRAFTAPITEVTVARLAVLSAGREPELHICRYANEHMLAAFFWLFKTLRGFGRTSHVSKRLCQSLGDQRTAVSLLICRSFPCSALVPTFPHPFFFHLRLSESPDSTPPCTRVPHSFTHQSTGIYTLNTFLLFARLLWANSCLCRCVSALVFIKIITESYFRLHS